MIFDLEAACDPERLCCDICVIGAGAVGLVTAVQLARAGHRVVLLESGGAAIEDRAQELLRVHSVGHPYRNTTLGRGRALGGTTTYWGGGILAVDSLVFDRRPWVSDSEWPFAHEVLKSYYNKVYEILGLGRVAQDDDEVWRCLKLERPDLGTEIEFPLTRWVPRRNLARLFKNEIDGAEQLKVVVHANVYQFRMGQARKIEGVLATSFNNRKLTVEARSIVVAAGTIDSVRLLLQPLEECRAAPWHANYWLGRGFIDHLTCIAGSVKIQNYKAFHNLFDHLYLSGYQFSPKMQLSPAVQKREELVDICGQFLFETNFRPHLEEVKMFARSLIHGALPNNSWRILQQTMAVSKFAIPLLLRYAFQHRSFKPKGDSVRLSLSCEQIPQRSSVLRIISERDSLGMPRIEIDWRIDGRELRTLSTFARRIRDVLASRQLALVELDPLLEFEDPTYLEKVSDAIHQMSTARIGRTAIEGVVDENLRVHGTDNLFIAGAAVFPTSGFANPTFTAIALGLKLCDHLAKQ